MLTLLSATVLLCGFASVVQAAATGNFNGTAPTCLRTATAPCGDVAVYYNASGVDGVALFTKVGTANANEVYHGAVSSPQTIRIQSSVGQATKLQLYGFIWKYGEWGSCSSGRQTRTASCTRNDGVAAPNESYCKTSPSLAQGCVTSSSGRASRVASFTAPQTVRLMEEGIASDTESDVRLYLSNVSRNGSVEIALSGGNCTDTACTNTRAATKNLTLSINQSTSWNRVGQGALVITLLSTADEEATFSLSKGTSESAPGGPLAEAFITSLQQNQPDLFFSANGTTATDGHTSISVTPGSTATLRWNSFGDSSGLCDSTNTGGQSAWAGTDSKTCSDSTENSQIITLGTTAGTYTYSLKAANAQGSVTKSVTIIVDSFKSIDNTIQTGGTSVSNTAQTVTLRGFTLGRDSCKIDQGQTACQPKILNGSESNLPVADGDFNGAAGVKVYTYDPATRAYTGLFFDSAITGTLSFVNRIVSGVKPGTAAAPSLLLRAFIYDWKNTGIGSCVNGLRAYVFTCTRSDGVAAHDVDCAQKPKPTGTSGESCTNYTPLPRSTGPANTNYIIVDKAGNQVAPPLDATPGAEHYSTSVDPIPQYPEGSEVSVKIITTPGTTVTAHDYHFTNFDNTNNPDAIITTGQGKSVMTAAPPPPPAKTPPPSVTPPATVNPPPAVTPPPAGGGGGGGGNRLREMLR